MKSFNPLLDPSLDGKIITDNMNGRFMTVSGVTPVVLAGNRSGSQGLFVAKPGFDVRNALDNQLIFNSNQNVFKIVSKGSTTLLSPNSAGSSTNVTVPHNLGYKPIVFAYASFTASGTRYPLPYLDPNLTPGAGTIRYQVSFEMPDENTLTFYHRDLGAASNVTDYITYYLLQETST